MVQGRWRITSNSVFYLERDMILLPNMCLSFAHTQITAGNLIDVTFWWDETDLTP